MALNETPTVDELVPDRIGRQLSPAYMWALVGVFAALHFVVSMIPFSVAVGAEGVITLGMITGAICGFLLGPFYGGAAVLTGSLLLGLVNPASMVIGPLTPLATVTGAVSAGSFRTGRVYVPALVYLVTIVLFLLGPGGPQGIIVVWFHVAGLALACLLLLRVVSARIHRQWSAKSGHGAEFFASVWMGAFLAVMNDHIVGLTAFIYYYHYIVGLDSNVIGGILVGIALVYPIERLLVSLIAAMILVPVIIAVQRGGLPMPNWDRRVETSDSQSHQGLPADIKHFSS